MWKTEPTRQNINSAQFDLKEHFVLPPGGFAFVSAWIYPGDKSKHLHMTFSVGEMKNEHAFGIGSHAKRTFTGWGPFITKEDFKRLKILPLDIYCHGYEFMLGPSISVLYLGNYTLLKGDSISDLANHMINYLIEPNGQEIVDKLWGLWPNNVTEPVDTETAFEKSHHLHFSSRGMTVSAYG